MARPAPLRPPTRPRRWCPLALAVGAATAAALPVHAQEVALRWELPAGDIYQGQTFPLTLEVTATAPPQGGFVQLFPQPLGLPVQIEGFGAIEQLELVPRADTGDCSVVLDGELARAQDLDPDPSVTRLRLSCLARPRRSGPAALPAITARYAVTSAFRDDLVRGSVPVDRTEGSARGDAVTLDVLPLPEADQPIDFEGAVGSLALEVSVTPNRVMVGETLQLAVACLGGSLNDGRAEPRLEAVEGLRVVGRRSERIWEGQRVGRTFWYDLEATSTAAIATPAVRLVTFDPVADPPAYRILKGAPLPVAIRPAPGSAAPSPPSAHGTPAADGDTAPEPTGKPRLIWTPAVLGFIVLLAVTSTLRRRRQAPGGHP
jgi:hypothetical protein